MATREELSRLFSRGTPSRRSSPAPAAAPPSGGAPAAALPPPPDGYQYMYDQTHGRYVLVQVALPGARQPSGMVSPGGQPIGAPGAVGTRSAQMLRPGVDKAGVPVDPYGAFLEKVPDLDPRQNTMAQQLYPHLVPDTAQVMQQFPPPRPLHEKASDNADPAQDAWGRSPPKIIAPGLE